MKSNKMNQDKQSKVVTDLTDEELVEISKNNQKETEKIRGLLTHGISEMDNQIKLIGSVFSDFTQRNGVLFTLAGLLSFLPVPVEEKSFYIRYFLTWIFPFLIFAIIFFFLSSRRSSAIKTQFVSVVPGYLEELPVLKMESVAKKAVWEGQYAIFNYVVFYYRLTTLFTYMYIASFFLNYYLFSFFETIDLITSIIVTLLIFVIGIKIFLWWKTKSSTVNYSFMKP